MVDNSSLEIIKKKIEQYEKDLKYISNAMKNIDRIKTARIKVKFDDLMVDTITDLGKNINELKQYVDYINKE